MKKRGARDLLLFLGVILVLVTMATMLWESEQPPEPTYSDIVRDFEQKKVQKYVIDGGILTIELRDGTKKAFDLTDPQIRADFRMDLGELLKV